MAKEEEEEKTLIAKKSVRRVQKNAIGISRVAGTPQSARFAVINLTNESVYLTQDGSGDISESKLSLKGRIINAGDQKELRVPVLGGESGYEVSIETEMLQSSTQAKEAASVISRTFDRKFNSIEAKIFGNPLLEIGDIVSFNYENKDIISSNKEYYIITRISQKFSDGLETEVTMKPLLQTNAASKQTV